MRIAVTGHRDLRGTTMLDVDTALRMLLGEFEDEGPMVGITCLDDGPEARTGAAMAMLDAAEHLVAVWDGGPAGIAGGTADVVEAAKDRGLPVTVVWPEGAERDERR
jgi:hypothetical protein